MATAIDLEYPFGGKWLVQNSPANRVPSHGTTLLATSYAIDFVPVDDSGRTAPITLGSLLRPESPERFPGFGRILLAPVDGIIVAAHDMEPDHPAYRGLPSIGYALTQQHRARTGWVTLAGNHERSGAVCPATKNSSTSPSRSSHPPIDRGGTIGHHSVIHEAQ